MSDEMIAVVKAYSAVSAGAPTAAPGDYDLAQTFATAGALMPPVDPKQLSIIYRLSSILRPCVESIAVNTTSFDHRLEPIIDLDKSDAPKLVREAIIQDRLAQGDLSEPSDADVEQATSQIKSEQLQEKMLLTRFFGYACPTRSFGRLRYETTVEEESVGNSYWECLRNNERRPAYFDRVESHSMRLRRIDRDYVQVTTRQRRSPIAYEECEVPRRFRTYVQVALGIPTVYFKEYGDPRVWSSHTGRMYESLDDLHASEGLDAAEATEIVHFASFDLLGPYGLPPWYGAQFAVLGTLYSERVNHDLLNNNAIPPMALFISGGKLADGAVKRIQDHIETTIKGASSRTKILILEAEGASSAAGGSRCRIELHPLKSAQEDDQLFQKFEENNFKKVRKQWRLPELLVGESQEVNRAQADAALEMAEQQVIQPRRSMFDAWVNRFLLPELNVKHFRFVTNSASSTDPEQQTKIGTEWVKAGVLTPNQGLVIAGEVLNKDFPPIKDPWGDIPQPLMLAGFLPGKADDGKEVAPAKDAASIASQMIALRDALASGAAGGAALADMKKRMEEATEVVKVPAEVWTKWFA